MKRPNNLFQKKYISSLVIAAFLILSVLTAYNIKIGNADGRKSDNKTKTENTEKSNDVIGPVSGSDTDSAAGSASDSTENNDMDAEWGEETNDKTETNDRAVTEKEDSDEQKDEQTTDRERSGSGIESSDAVYNYNGKLRMVTVGKGHDMGMSLYGANVLAKKQLSAATILSYYYPGTKILD